MRSCYVHVCEDVQLEAESQHQANAFSSSRKRSHMTSKPTAKSCSSWKLTGTKLRADALRCTLPSCHWMSAVVREPTTCDRTISALGLRGRAAYCH